MKRLKFYTTTKGSLDILVGNYKLQLYYPVIFIKDKFNIFLELQTCCGIKRRNSYFGFGLIILGFGIGIGAYTKKTYYEKV